MIDPKRLTEKDKGREVKLPGSIGESHQAGKLVRWCGSVVFVKCPACKPDEMMYPPEAIDFVQGTYQDGGAE